MDETTKTKLYELGVRRCIKRDPKNGDFMADTLGTSTLTMACEEREDGLCQVFLVAQDTGADVGAFKTALVDYVKEVTPEQIAETLNADADYVRAGVEDATRELLGYTEEREDEPEEDYDAVIAQIKADLGIP